MIFDFPYIDYVIHEVLRMYPPLPRYTGHYDPKFFLIKFTHQINLKCRIERACSKDVTYNGINIRKGTLVTVPTFALHYDEKYYPEPHLFNPERC